MKIYGLSKALVSETFNFVILIMVVLKTKTKTIPSKNNGRMEGRTKKIYGELFLPMYRCVGWFPRPCSYSPKSQYSFKHKYNISNMDLVGYTKRFLHVS